MSKKKQILAAARQLFAHKDYKDASMAELSALTGVATGTIFYHFKTKEDLFLAVLEEVRATILSRFEGYFSSRVFTDGLSMTEGAIAFYLQLAGEIEDRFLLLQRHYPYQLAMTNQVCRNTLESIYGGLIHIFEQAIQTGRADGSIGAIPAEKTALIILSTVDGVVRYKTYGLYDAGTLYHTLMAACRRMLAPEPSRQTAGCR